MDFHKMKKDVAKESKLVEHENFNSATYSPNAFTDPYPLSPTKVHSRDYKDATGVT